MKDNRIITRYSENFKLKILNEIESGKYSKSEIIRIYGIGAGTIYGWIKKYSKFELLNRRVKIETMKEKDQIQSLKEEIKKLKEALVKKDLDLIVYDSYLEVTAKRLGFKNIEELKKNLEKKQSI